MRITEANDLDEKVQEIQALLEKEDYKAAIEKSTEMTDELEPNVVPLASAALFKAVATMTQAMNEMAETGDKPSMELFEQVWQYLELSAQLEPDNEQVKQEKAKVAALLRELTVAYPEAPPEEVAKADYDVLVVGAGCSGVGTALMLTATFGLTKDRVVCIERGAEVGESFRRWPKEMRFISPSFNQQGWTGTFDLNSISKGTSPAFSLHAEHPSGNEYANYLQAIANKHELNIKHRTEVLSVKSIGTEEVPFFSVDIKSLGNSGAASSSSGGVGTTQTVTARFIVWAAGEFQYPHAPPSSGDAASVAPMEVEGSEKKKTFMDEVKEVKEAKEDGEHDHDHGHGHAHGAAKSDIAKTSQGLPGSELCMHNSQVRSWAEVPGTDFIVIGGYESGIDATVNLAKAGKQVTVMASTPCWGVLNADASMELAPYTANRLRECLSDDFKGPKPKLYAPLRVVRVEKNAEKGGFNVVAVWKQAEEASHAPLREMVAKAPEESIGTEGSTITLHTPNPPILGTGFEGSVAAAAPHLFEFADSSDPEKKGCLDGAPLLTKDDESTKVPGVFLVGPTVSHGHLSFCFVYKFRQRFAVVANAICEGLGVDTKAAVIECRKNNMYLDDFSCCADTCGDTC